MKASFFLFSVLAAIAAAKTTTDVVNNKPSPTVQDKSKTIERKANATHEAESTPTILEERDPAVTHEADSTPTGLEERDPAVSHEADSTAKNNKANTSVEKRAESTGDVGE